MDTKKKPERAPSREPPGLTRAALDLLALMGEQEPHNHHCTAAWPVNASGWA